MKSRVINSLLTNGMRVQRIGSARPLGHGRLALSGVAGALLLSGCYYPYGYYPAYYPSAYPAYPAWYGYGYPGWYGYGYPGWYGPAVSIGFGWSWGGGRGRHH